MHSFPGVALPCGRVRPRRTQAGDEPEFSSKLNLFENCGNGYGLVMQTFYKRFSVITGFAVLLIILVGNALVTRRQLAVQIDNQVGVLHTRQVLSELQQTQILLVDAETGQRGFLYTGDLKYLAPYRSAAQQIAAHLDNLAQLTADNPRHRAHMTVLRNLTQEKLHELAQTLSLYQGGHPDQARALVLSDVGLATMNNIRVVMGQMQQEEASLEAVRTEDYKKSIRVTIAAIYLASLLATLGLILLAYYILQEMELRERHAQEIHAREEWFRVTLTSIGDAVIAADQHGRVTFLNPVAEALTGTTMLEAMGKDIREVFPIFNEYTGEVTENPVKKVMDLGIVVGLANHTVLKHQNGTLIPIEDSAAPIKNDRDQLVGVVLVFRDVADERKSQEILRKTEKLAAAARLSATVAHEINNPLEAVVNLIYIAKAAPDAPPAVVQQLSLAEQELERVAHITRQTLGFYRESYVPEQIEVSALVESVLRLYSNKLAAKNIHVERHFGECPTVKGVPGELKQVISNLVSNAIDAVGKDGTITVRLLCVEQATGGFAQIVIEDDGPGIPAEHADRIFEPFFTTKKDVGTGLGLWVTKEIVSRHGGSILVRARDGEHAPQGAAFTICLPVKPDFLDEADHHLSN